MLAIVNTGASMAGYRVSGRRAVAVATPVDLGALVREARKQRGWTQSQLGTRVGASRFWVAEFERGKPGAELGLALRAVVAVGLRIKVERPVSPTDEPPSVPGGAAQQPGSTSRSAIRKAEVGRDPDLTSTRPQAASLPPQAELRAATINLDEIVNAARAGLQHVAAPATTVPRAKQARRPAATSGRDATRTAPTRDTRRGR